MTIPEISAPDEPVLLCAQCDRPAPTDPSLLGLWRHSSLVTSPVDELTVKMLLCPACIDDDHEGAFDSGAGD